mgnify:CR=1 FL=1
MQNFNESLQAKYPHLELAILPLSQVNKDNESKRIDSEYFKKEYLENEEIIVSQSKVKDFLEFRIKNIKTLNLNKILLICKLATLTQITGLNTPRQKLILRKYQIGRLMFYATMIFVSLPSAQIEMLSH